jgi:hypothetical protein
MALPVVIELNVHFSLPRHNEYKATVHKIKIMAKSKTSLEQSITEKSSLRYNEQ